MSQLVTNKICSMLSPTVNYDAALDYQPLSVVDSLFWIRIFIPQESHPIPCFIASLPVFMSLLLPFTTL